jgi:hypothetical protein
VLEIEVGIVDKEGRMKTGALFCDKGGKCTLEAILYLVHCLCIWYPK